MLVVSGGVICDEGILEMFSGKDTIGFEVRQVLSSVNDFKALDGSGPLSMSYLFWLGLSADVTSAQTV